MDRNTPSALPGARRSRPPDRRAAPAGGRPRPAPGSRRRTAVTAVVLALAGQLAIAGAARAAGPVVVSLTFDDGRASQAAALGPLAAHGMRATFYLNSGRLDTPGFLTGVQATSIGAAGHEIGGHTHLHEDLTALSAGEAQATVCDDRANLMNRGFTVTSFAYPFGAANGTARAAAQVCGYGSARGVGGLRGPSSCLSCPTAEQVPPSDPWYVATPDSVKSTTTLATLESYVQQAQAGGGGWVPLVFHDVGTGGPLSLPTATFGAFLDWLAAQPGTVVRTVADALGTTPGGGPGGSGGPPANLIVNASLETGSPTPTCFLRAGYGVNTYTWTRSPVASEGAWSQQVDMTSRTSGDRKLVPVLDDGQAAGGCAPDVTPGASYDLAVSYRSSRAVYFVAYYRDAGGTWRYWETGPGQPASAGYSRATWTTPPLPVGATALSFGLTLTDVGSLTVDDFSMDAR